ncbi:MAG: NAD+ synthase [Gammaproteobacteria bacterium]|nr:MAG: NAD+ synthase [Gammaproteobacteria bacterium]
MSDSTLGIALAQFNPKVGDIPGNTRRIIELIRRSRDELGCDLVMFPELAICGYPPEDLLLRNDFIRACESALTQVRQAAHGIAVLIGHPHRQEGLLYNACSLMVEGDVTITYHKRHLPNYRVFDEKRYFHPGQTPCVTRIAGQRVALSICEDIWQNDVIDEAAAAGATLVLNINASPYHMGKSREREELLLRHWRRCGVAIAYLNQVGGQDELVFDGASIVVGRDGGLLRPAPQFRESLIRVGYELTGGRFLGPPDQEPLDPEEEVWQALCLGVRDYAGKNGFSDVVLGLSGGIDSALTLTIAVDALGPERATAVLMPSRHTAQMSIDDALAQCRTLGVAHQLIPIEPMYTAFLEALATPFDALPPDATEENIQARVRGTLLMAFSNKFGSLLLSTGNKSEMSVGYSTLYGDMAGGFAPLKDVSKLWVYRLARWRNGGDPVIPERVLTRPPSAELRPDQKDQDTLPPYEVLDPILRLYIEEDAPPEAIVAAGFDARTVARVVRMVDRSEYKRRQAAPGVRITERAFGRDRRYPITNGFDPVRGLAGNGST